MYTISHVHHTCMCVYVHSKRVICVVRSIQFHFVMNVAVGAANGPFHDSATNRGGVESYKKPWRDGLTQIEAMNDFYK